MRIILVLITVIAGIFLVKPILINGDYTTVTFLDVGQGSATHIQTIDNRELLVDSGETNKTLRNMAKIRRWWDTEIDVLIGSHADKDHIGMFPEIIERYDIQTYIDSGRQEDSPVYDAIVDELKKSDTSHIHVQARDHFMIEEEVSLLFLHPHWNTKDTYNDNDSSLVFILEIYGMTFLFMGDASAKIEEQIAGQYSNLLDVDVLVVGHHGSKTSTSELFLDVVNPTYAIISSGEDNRYGHPHQLILDRLYKKGVYVLRTDTLGNIQFKIYETQEFDIVVK